MDAQKEIKKQCLKVKKCVLYNGIIIFDALSTSSKFNVLKANGNDREALYAEISLDLPWDPGHYVYIDLMSTYIFERLLKERQVYESLEILENDISELIDNIESTLLRKNLEYGNSVLEPLRVFSGASNIEQINVRLDDKLSRMQNDCKKTIKEDTMLDFIGYLILKMIAEKA